MNSKEIISIYENVSDITEQMVNAAQNGDWALLAKLEKKCSLHVNSVKNEASEVKLDQDERQRKIRAIHKILEDDRKIRDITQPRLAQLSQLISRSSTKRKLINAYQLDHRMR